MKFSRIKTQAWAWWKWVIGPKSMQKSTKAPRKPSGSYCKSNQWLVDKWINDCLTGESRIITRSYLSREEVWGLLQQWLWISWEELERVITLSRALGREKRPKRRKNMVMSSWFFQNWKNLALFQTRALGLFVQMPHTFTTATMKRLMVSFPFQAPPLKVTRDLVLGVEFSYIPETKGVPIVVDMSSNIMTRKVDVSKVRAWYKNFTIK